MAVQPLHLELRKCHYLIEENSHGGIIISSDVW
jgi:hypothetical protein